MRNALRQFFGRLYALTVFALCLPLLVAGVALAQAAPPVDPNTPSEQLVAMLFEAVSNSNWRLVAVVALMLLVWLLRKFGANWIPFLGTDKGGVALAMGLAVLGGVINGALAGKPINVSLVLSAIITGLATMGLWSGSKAATKPKA